MSYILDALKKAETERNLGEIPGVHAQPLHLASLTPEKRWRHQPWQWIAITCVVLVAGLIAWKWHPVESEPAQPVVSQVVPAPHSAPLPPPAAQAAPTQASAPALELQATTDFAPIPDKPAAKSSRKAERRTKHAGSDTEPKAPSQKAATDTEAPVSDMRDLPLNVQHEIPELTIGGYIYSATPADRSVLVNQRLLREGDQISPGLTLEGIRSDGLVLNYQGRRFSKSY